jgi:ABC-2 type transport system permease protein
VTNYSYSVYLFEEHTVQNLLLSLFCLWLFVCFIIALILLSGSIAGGSFGGLILSASILLLLILLNIIPAVKDYNPITLASVNVSLITGNMGSSDVLKAIWTTLASTLLALLIAVKLFEKKKL